MLIRIITVIFSILIIFNLTNVSIILKELTKKNKPTIMHKNNEIRIGQVFENSKHKGYSITEYQNNYEKISLFLFKTATVLLPIKNSSYLSTEQSYKTISSMPFISIPLNNKTDDNTIIVSFNISKDKRKRIILKKDNTETLVIKEYKYSENIHNKFKSFFGKYKFDADKIYHELILLIN